MIKSDISQHPTSSSRMTDSVNEPEELETSITEGETENVPKEVKLQSIMEAANALTALGDEEDAAAEGTAAPSILQAEQDATREARKDDSAPSIVAKPPQHKSVVATNTKRFLPEHKIQYNLPKESPEYSRKW